MASKKNQHVVPHAKGWAVKGEGNKRATSVHRTKQQAVKAGRSLAHRQKGELSVHGKDGQIQRKHSYGNDPHPPKG